MLIASSILLKLESIPVYRQTTTVSKIESSNRSKAELRKAHLKNSRSLCCSYPWNFIMMTMSAHLVEFKVTASVKRD
jgi:hypothetical protein